MRRDPLPHTFRRFPVYAVFLGNDRPEIHFSQRAARKHADIVNLYERVIHGDLRGAVAKKLSLVRPIPVAQEVQR